MKVKRAECDYCGWTKAEPNGPTCLTGREHFIHFVMTVLTCFLWLLVWVGHAIGRRTIFRPGWHCSTCGSKVK
jgi:hypothetical protein